MGIVDINLALAVVRAVQTVEVCDAVCGDRGDGDRPQIRAVIIIHALRGIVKSSPQNVKEPCFHTVLFVEFWFALTLRLRHSRCIRTQCSGEILGAAAYRLGFLQSARVIGVGCCSCTVAVTGLLSAVVVGVSLIPGGQRIAVCIVSVGGNGIADRFGKQAVVGIIGIGGDRAVSVHADAVAACIIGIGDAVLARGFACQSAQSVIGIGGGDRITAEQGLGLGALIAVGIVGIGKFADDDIFPVGIQQGVEHAGDEVGFVIGIGGGDCPRRLTCAVAVCIVGIGGGFAVDRDYIRLCFCKAL